MRRRILVVEDNELNAELLCDWLELHGYEVAAVSDLTGAFAAIHDGHFDGVLLDIRLGDEDGATLAVQMRKHPEYRNMPIIAVTAHALPAEQKRIIQAGCSAYVSKPIDFSTFGEKLDRWLSSSPSSTVPSQKN